MLETALNKIRLFDNKFSKEITQFLIKYNLPTPPPFFTKYIPFFVKVIFYSTLLVIPLVTVRFLYPYNKKILSLIIIAILILIGLSTFGIFLGFFQLVYSF